MAGSFQCTDCNLDEDEINSYDAGEFSEILDLLADHYIDQDLATNTLEAQNLLFEHLRQRDNPDGSQSVRTDVVRRAVDEHHNRRTELLSCAQSVKSFVSDLPQQRKKELKRFFPRYESDLERVIAELKNDTCQFIVAGETGSGKSCFINLLMGHAGQNFLPVSVCPSTSCLCEISYGDKGQISAFTAEQEEPVERHAMCEANMTEMLSKYTHQKEKRSDIIYSKVEVKWPLEWLKSGLTLVDTPGVGESSVITAMVKERMPKAYGFIYVINTTKAGGIQQDELEDLLLKPSTSKFKKDETTYLSDVFDPRTAIFIFNKWDIIENSERDKIKKFAIDKIKSIYEDIDPENQIFFLSTEQASTTLEKASYVTEEFQRVLKGIEKLMEGSMRSKMAVYYNYLVQLISRLAFILRVYLGNFEAFQQKYVDIKSRLDELSHRHHAVEKKLRENLETEVEKIVSKLEEHLGNPATIEKLCTWHPENLPQDIKNWQLLERMCQAACKQRVDNTIKQWESETQAIQTANKNLLRVFQSEFHSLSGDLANVEQDLLSGEINEKEMRQVMRDIGTSLMNEKGVNFGAKEIVILGVLSPILLPVGLVVGLIASPIMAVMAIRKTIRQQQKKQDYYEGYLEGKTGSIADLMAKETKERLADVTSGDGIKKVIEERMKDLVSKMLQLVQKIPDFIKADKEMLSNLKYEMDEGVKEETKEQCQHLYSDVKMLQMKLDFLYFMHIHENDFEVCDVILGDWIGHGSFGKVYRATLQRGGESLEIALKEPKDLFTPMLAPDIKLEDGNMRKPDCENIVKYYGLCMGEGDSLQKQIPAEQNVGAPLNYMPDKTPYMAMELCDDCLTEIVYNKSRYIGPAVYKHNYAPRSADGTQERDSLYMMADFAKQIANGLNTMHNMGMVHRDLKPANILVKNVTDKDGVKRPVLKLCDFGLSKMEEEAQTVHIGTLLYMAPEVFRGQSYDRSADVFSYGLIMIELFYGQMLKNIKVAEVTTKPTKFGRNPFSYSSPPGEWKRLIEKCISETPSERPTIKECFDLFQAHIL